MGPGHYSKEVYFLFTEEYDFQKKDGSGKKGMEYTFRGELGLRI